MAWQTPKTDWVNNPKSPTADDFNRIEGNIEHLLDEIETKKGALVDAINMKEDLVTIESSYQEMANAIEYINTNYKRTAQGSASFQQINSTTIRLVVAGIDFEPSRVFVQGSFSARAGAAGFTAYPYAFVEGVFRPTVLVVAPGMSASANGNVTKTLDGFIFTVTGTDDVVATPGQVWYCYE